MTGTLPGYLSKDLAKLHERAMRMYISGSERARKQFATLKQEGNWSRNASAIVSGIVTGDVPVSYWPVFFYLSVVTVPEVC